MKRLMHHKKKEEVRKDLYLKLNAIVESFNMDKSMNGIQIKDSCYFARFINEITRACIDSLPKKKAIDQTSNYRQGFTEGFNKCVDAMEYTLLRARYTC